MYECKYLCMNEFMYVSMYVCMDKGTYACNECMNVGMYECMYE